jgi:hypothetical protein
MLGEKEPIMLVESEGRIRKHKRIRRENFLKRLSTILSYFKTDGASGGSLPRRTDNQKGYIARTLLTSPSQTHA